MSLVVVLELLLISGLVAYLLSYLSDKKESGWWVISMAFLSWTLSFLIVFLIPLDLSSNMYRSCLQAGGLDCHQPFNYVSEEFLVASWKTMYWIAFVLTWFLIPLTIAYVNSGEFGFFRKTGAAIKDNLINFAVMGALVGIFSIYIVMRKHFSTQQLLGYMMALANTYGLFLLIAFLGYGLVDIPRLCWRSGNHQAALERYEFVASRLHEELSLAALEYEDLLTELHTVSRRVSFDDPLRVYVDEILGKVPVGWDHNRSISIDTPVEVVNMRYLARLHRNIIRKSILKQRAEWRWEELLKRAFYLQDISISTRNPERKFTSSLFTARNRPSEVRLSWMWYWHVIFEPFVTKGLSVLLVFFSLTLVWSEVTFFSNDPLLSLYAWLVGRANLGYSAVQLISLLTIGYMCLCAYSSLMRLRLFNYYVLLPQNHTDSTSLLFCGAYLCRLTFPLCFNYLFLIHFNNLAFSKVMGKMDLIPILGREFIVYFPMFIIVLCLIAISNVYGRLLQFVYVKNFLQEDSSSNILEGKALIDRERARKERNTRLDVRFPEFSPLESALASELDENEIPSIIKKSPLM